MTGGPGYGIQARQLFYYAVALINLRAFKWTVSRWMRLAAFEHPGKDKCDALDITLGKDRVAQVRPAVAHEVSTLVEVSGMSQPECVTDLMQGHPADVLSAVIVAPRHV